MSRLNLWELPMCQASGYISSSRTLSPINGRSDYFYRRVDGDSDTVRVSFKFIRLLIFTYFRLHWVLIDVHGLSLAVASRGDSLVAVSDFSLRWLLLLQSTGSKALGLQSLQLVGSREQAQ